MPAPKDLNIQEMASEYCFDYTKAKPNRFAEKININVGWTVERFVEEQKEEKPKSKISSPNGKAAAKKVTPKKKPMAKPDAKKSTPNKKVSRPAKQTKAKKKK